MSLLSSRKRCLLSLLTALGTLFSVGQAQTSNRATDFRSQTSGEDSRRDRRSNMTPEEMRQRMTAALREQFKVENDEEWTLISERIMKVQDLRRSTMMGGTFMGLMGRSMGGHSGSDTGSRFRSSMSGSGSSPEVQALTAALRNNATNADLKARLERLREVRTQNAAKLATAQEELRAVLDLRQEALAVLMGLLP